MWRSLMFKFPSTTITAICLTVVNGLFSDTASLEPIPYGPIPHSRQIKWGQIERITMVNFSSITFCGREWGYGDEATDLINPTDFDANRARS